MSTPTHHGQNMLDIKGDVAHRLESNGALDQIRAQIRASVYRALLGAKEDGALPAQSDCMAEVPLPMVSVVSDFLESFDLGMTKEVFLQESSQKPMVRNDLEKELADTSPGLLGAKQEPAEADDSQRAVLEQVLAVAQQHGKRSGLPGTIPEEVEACK
eukprot:TRINITY_DN21093_c0_g1_i1.p1 TRINITY_DN21093_c0_g1~~TRINITY_DN21093_c0_g1_i1.p1  ORF type:complete len:158 (-),score=45.60 TRINITY_DN21093_c0_g1_i1:140-613(-)